MKHLAPGKVRPALSLVVYSNDVAEAIAFMFNDTLICDDAASAQAVTFARNTACGVSRPMGTCTSWAGRCPAARHQSGLARLCERRSCVLRRSGSKLRRGRLRRLSARKPRGV